MNLRANIAAFFRRFAENHGLSMAKLQMKTDVSRNTFYACIRGEANPRLSSIECIAASLGVDPAAILLGVYDPASSEVSVLLLNTIRGVSELTPEERQQFFRQLVREMVRLWDEE